MSHCLKQLEAVCAALPEMPETGNLPPGADESPGTADDDMTSAAPAGKHSPMS